MSGLQDHEPLAAALASVSPYGRVLLLYLHEPEMLQRPDSAVQHFEFVQECLFDMSQALLGVKGLLHVRFGPPVEVLDALSHVEGVQLTRVLGYPETT